MLLLTYLMRISNLKLNSYSVIINNEKQQDNYNESKKESKYQDFIESQIIVEKLDYINDINNKEKYFEKQVVYSHKGVK